MPTTPSPADLEDLAASLEMVAERRAAPLRAAVGFDGFVDEIARVVGERRGPDDWTPIDRLEDFGRLLTVAAGSVGREVVTERVEAGGNGPNLAGGLAALGAEVDFYGTLGRPIHAAFAEFATACRRCVSLGEVGRTLALEFSDGKLMLNETSGPRAFGLQEMRAALDAGLRESLLRADIIGLVNWSRFPAMTPCWELVRENALARHPGRPLVLIDPADPSGRAPQDVAEMLRVAASLCDRAEVVLSLNMREAQAAARALDLEPSGDLLEAARQLRALVAVDAVVVHERRRAACAFEGGDVDAATALTPAPLLSTGVGDRFNAGLCWGVRQGLGWRPSLLLACAAGGWFVREGRPASLADLPGFCRTWASLIDHTGSGF